MFHIEQVSITLTQCSHSAVIRIYIVPRYIVTTIKMFIETRLFSISCKLIWQYAFLCENKPIAKITWFTWRPHSFSCFLKIEVIWWPVSHGSFLNRHDTALSTIRNQRRENANIRPFKHIQIFTLSCPRLSLTIFLGVRDVRIIL